MKSDFEDRLRPTARNLRELQSHPMDWWEGHTEPEWLRVIDTRPSPWRRLMRWLRARFTWGWLR